MRKMTGWLRVALIDLRGDLRRFVILIACLALGVGAIATIGSVGAALQSALDHDARLFLGGDLEARLTWRPANAEERGLFSSLGRFTEIVEVNARATSGGKAAFLSLRAVDDAYPLVGTVTFHDALPAYAGLADLLATRDGTQGAIVDPLLLDRLGIRIGDAFTIGKARFEARAVLDTLPDQAARGLQLGASVLVSTKALGPAGITGPGVLARYRYNIALAGIDYAAAARKIEAAFPEAGWQLRAPKDATASFARFFDLFDRFLILVGLSSLLVGGVGVSNGVTAYITERQRSIATMRSLGATSARLFTHFLAQILALSGLAIIIGLALGALTTLILLPVLGQLLSLDLQPSLHVVPLASAAAFGLLIAFGFAFLPLLRAQNLRPASLFRTSGSGVAEGHLDWRQMLRPRASLPLLVVVLGLSGLAALTTREPMLVAWYAVGVLGAFLALRLAAWALQATLRRLPPLRNTTLRHGIGAIHRPGSIAPIVMLSLGLGLSLLLLISLIEANLRGQLDGQIAAEAPSFVLLNMQKAELDGLKALAATDGRIEKVEASPMLRGTLTAVKGQPVTALKDLSRAGKALLRGDQSITWSARLPKGETIASGKWWPPDYAGKPLVSLDRDYEKPLGLAVGDTIEIAISGRPIELTIASFRDIDVSRPGLSFPVVISPGMIEAAPATLIGSITAEPGSATSLEAELAGRFPALTFIPVGDVLARIAGLLSNLASAVSLVGAIAVLSGVLVLAGALAAGRAQRQAEAVVMKVLGMTRADITRAFVVEYGLLGALSAALAAIFGALGAWLLVTQVMKLPFSLDPGLLATVLLGAMATTLVTGLAVTWSALSTRPARYLREFD